MANREIDSPAPGESVAKYYNQGDLGIGRSMHCKYKSSTDETACYVRNYSSDPTDSGPSHSGQRFGVSSITAFAKMDRDDAFATVAMVARGGMRPDEPNKVIFMVYDATGKLTNTAPLDRHALKKLGKKGEDFNAHIPSNCMVCHGAGGKYIPQDSANDTPGAYKAMFLPFDLDNFQYHPTTAALSRLNQEGVFKDLNTKIVRPVAVQYKADAIVNTIDGWYNNLFKSFTFPSPFPSVPFPPIFLSSTFLSNYVPTGWSSREGTDPDDLKYGDKHFFQRVLRPYCRTCHQTFVQDDPLSFEIWVYLDQYSGIAADYVCPPGKETPNKMPQAEQVSRIFWQSDARGIFVGYLSAKVSLKRKNLDVQECLPGPNVR